MSNPEELDRRGGAAGPAPEEPAEAVTGGEARRIVNRVFEEAWNRGEVAVLDEVLEPGCLGHGPGDGVVTTEQLKQRILERRKAMPDLHYTVQRFIVEGAWVATLWTGTGTSQAAPEDVAELVRLSGITVWRVRGSRIAEAWVLGDEGARGWGPVGD
ncbi:MAG TPA: ester cyclase [Acidimicrobiales bacterium]|nr:ester cyclase [Acidimicrobiales bacterium]